MADFPAWVSMEINTGRQREQVAATGHLLSFLKHWLMGLTGTHNNQFAKQHVDEVGTLVFYKYKNYSQVLTPHTAVNRLTAGGRRRGSVLCQNYEFSYSKHLKYSSAN